MPEVTFGHSPYKKMFDNADVYGIGYDEARSAKRKVRLGIIGFGGVALSKHIPAIARLRAIWEPIELAAVCCRNRQSGMRASEIYNAAWYGTVKEMLDNEQLDGVIVCSPDTLHYQHALQCLERRLHVLMEKPLTDSLRTAKALCDKAKEAGCVLMTVSNKRFSPPYFKAKGFLDDGTISDPTMFITKFNLGYDYVNILEGGTVHVLDLMRYFMGDVKMLSAVGSKRYSFNKTGYPFDNGIAMVTFESGAVGTVYTSNCALSLKPWEVVEIYGEKKWLKVDDQYLLTLYDNETGPSKTWAPVIPNTLFFDEEFGGFMGLIENFADCIRGTAEPLVTGWDGFKACELVSAFHIAAATGDKLTLPLDIDLADSAVKKIMGR